MRLLLEHRVLVPDQFVFLLLHLLALQLPILRQGVNLYRLRILLFLFRLLLLLFFIIVIIVAGRIAKIDGSCQPQVGLHSSVVLQLEHHRLDRALNILQIKSFILRELCVLFEFGLHRHDCLEGFVGVEGFFLVVQLLFVPFEV